MRNDSRLPGLSFPDGLTLSGVRPDLGAINADAKVALIKFRAGMLGLEREGGS